MDLSLILLFIFNNRTWGEFTKICILQDCTAIISYMMLTLKSLVMVNKCFKREGAINSMNHELQGILLTITWYYLLCTFHKLMWTLHANKQSKQNETSNALHPSKVYFYSAEYFGFFTLLKKGGSGVGKMEGRKCPVDFASNASGRSLFWTPSLETSLWKSCFQQPKSGEFRLKMSLSCSSCSLSKP